MDPLTLTDDFKKLGVSKVVQYTNDENLVSEIQNKYKVVSINRGIENISIRFISETKPSYEKIKLIEPKFEDVYMFYFDLEDAREV